MTEHHSGDSGGGAFARIPGWDGNPNTWWRYKQDVELWLEGEDLEVKYSIAARMVQKLTGTARIRANLLDVRHLRPQRPVARVPAVVDSAGNEVTPEVPAVLADWRAGIDYLLEDLEKMPGIPKVVRKGAQRSWFYESLTRRPGETMANWLTRFRAGLKRCADEGVKMDNQEDLGWWLVKKSLLSKERKERLLARLTTDYDYAEVEREMLAIFADIHVGEGRPQPSASRPRPRQANVTETGSEASEGSRDRSEDVGSDSGSTTADPEPGEVEEALERELTALAAIVEDSPDHDELETIHAAAEQVQEALITMRESKRKIQAAKKDRNYTPKGRPRTPSPHPKSGKPSSSSSTAGSSRDIQKRKDNSNCKGCGEKGHWGGDPQCK